MSNSDCGVIYYAGRKKKFLKEVNNSARSVKEKLDNISTILFTDGNDTELIDKSLFDEIIIDEKPGNPKLRKISFLSESPFKKTLYLDTDTELLEPVWELFELLDYFDLALSHAPLRENNFTDNLEVECFPECNSGVMIYKKSESVIRFFQNWGEIFQTYLDRGIKKDQPALRKALYNSDMRFYILPPEYNLRTVYPFFAGNMKVKILHGREDTLERARDRINKSIKVRIGSFRKPTLTEKFKKLFKK